MKYGVPAFMAIFPLTWFLLLKLVRVPVERLDVEPARKRVEDMGPMKAKEKEILFILLIAACLWVAGPFVEGILNLPKTLLSSALVAVMTVCYMAVRLIITWEDIKGVSWGIFLIIGAGLSLGDTLVRTGVTGWFSNIVAPLVVELPFLATLILLILISALLTNLMNNTTIAAVFVPVLISLAIDVQPFEPVHLVLPVSLATAFGYSLPSASGRMALIASTGIVERGDMFKYGLVLTVVSSLILAFVFYAMLLLELA